MAVAVAFIFFAEKQKTLKTASSESITTTTIGAAPAEPVSQPSANTKTEQSNSNSLSISDYLKTIDPKANWRINKADDGRVIAISGGLIPVDTKNQMEALKFAQTIAEKTGVPAAQIIASEVVLDSTPYSTAQQFDQEVSGYSVFGGFMKVFTRVPGGEVYYVANETRNVGEPKLTINYSLGEIQAVVREEYANRKGLKFETSAAKPVLFSTGPSQSELGWESVIEIAGPLYDRRHLVVSAVTGKILKDTSLIQH